MLCASNPLRSKSPEKCDLENQSQKTEIMRPPPRRFFGAVLPMRKAEETGPDTRHTIRRDAKSIIKI